MVIGVPVRIVGIDTALVNTGLVVLDYPSGVFVWAGKPFPKKDPRLVTDPTFLQYETIKQVTDWIWSSIMQWQGVNAPPFVAMEDYLISPRAGTHKIAELNSAIKDRLHQYKIPYCLVHPGKTKKYIKDANASKTDIIQYVKGCQPETFKDIERADYSDVADAWSIAKIGSLVWEAYCKNPNDPEGYVKTFVQEKRWREILCGESGILGKRGLAKLRY